MATWKRFGWNLAQWIEEGTLLITEPELYDFEKLLTHIEDSVAKIGAKRLVLDSASLIGNYFQDMFKLRQAMIDLEKLMERLECTAVIINEIQEGSDAVSTYGVEEYVADGVVVLYVLKHKNALHRAVLVRKMNGTDHSLKMHPFKIVSPGGIAIRPNGKVFGQL
jgi:KaiC/GvpD/RAD55 family RecA-like ATPase